MSRRFRCKTIPSSWLENNGRRLDCGPYLSGGTEAKELLKKLRTQPLKELTTGHDGGIFNAPRFPRVYVDDPEHGVPFLGSTDILQADLSDVALLSKKQVAGNPALVLYEGWTLITRSGTIGRMAYARTDMEGMAGSEHFMRVAPNLSKVKSGYLYAYLSSRFGVPIVLSGTYGAIVQHIEPHHIAHLPVPRLAEIEDQAHALVHRAASLRSDAANSITMATEHMLQELGLPELKSSDVTKLGWSAISSSNLRRRLDAPFHSPAALEADEAVRNGRHPAERLSKVTNRLFKPPIFKRLWVDGPEYGRQFVSGSDAYLHEASETRFVSNRTPNFEEFIVKRGWVIFQAAGKIYGLFGRPIFVSGWLEDIFCADDLYRIVPKTEIDGAFIYLFLRTPHGRALVKRQASGNSIPRVWDPHMADFELPWPGKSFRERLAGPVIDAHDKIAKALKLQKQAIALVETAIEVGGVDGQSRPHGSACQ